MPPDFAPKRLDQGRPADEYGHVGRCAPDIQYKSVSVVGSKGECAHDACRRAGEDRLPRCVEGGCETHGSPVALEHEDGDFETFLFQRVPDGLEKQPVHRVNSRVEPCGGDSPGEIQVCRNEVTRYYMVA